MKSTDSTASPALSGREAAKRPERLWSLGVNLEEEAEEAKERRHEMEQKLGMWEEIK